MSSAIGSRWYLARMAAVGAALGLAMMLTGDVGVHGAVASGIDPLEVLNLQIRNNALIIIDTSGSMTFPTAVNNFAPGGDDPMSRLYQAKAAVTAVVSANQNLMNFGLASYNVAASSKVLNGGQGYAGNIDEAPLVYVSADAGAAPFYDRSATCPRSGRGTREGFFCGLEDNNNFSNYNQGTPIGNTTTSTETYRSFGNGEDGGSEQYWAHPYPAGCTPGTDCRYYLESNLFRSGNEYVWDITSSNEGTVLLAVNTFTCPLPPVGLTGNNPDNTVPPDGLADEARPCIKMTAKNGPSGTVAGSAVYYYSSAIFTNTAGNNCGGAAVLSVVADCTGNNAPLVIDAMRPEIPVGNWNGTADFGLGSRVVGGTDASSSTQNLRNKAVPVAGVRAVQSTPLAKSLDDIRLNTTPNPAGGTGVFPPEAPSPGAGLQKNFVILLTDGDDTCASSTPSRAINVAKAAEALYGGPDFQHRAELMFIAFTNAVNVANSNMAAKTGSGGTVDNSGNVTCPPGVPCRDAFIATNTDELINALQNALEIAVASGTFVASPSVVGTVFEVGPEDPLDPSVRYSIGGTLRLSSNVLFQPSFQLPAWNSELTAFNNDGTATQLWQAGQTLDNNVSAVLQGQSRAGRPANRFTFSELHGGRTVDDIATGTALIRRRIFTSGGGGSWTRTSGEFDSSSPAGRNVVALWPPSQTGLMPETNAGAAISDIDPAVGTAGPLDDALGIGAGSATVLTFTDLQSKLGVCRSSTDPDPLNSGAAVPAPAACATSDMPTARKEARQIILAWIAGAKLARGSDGLPLRNGAAGPEFGELLYRDRGTLMFDSTLAQSAVMQQPRGELQSDDHGREWTLYRDGHRNAAREGVPADLNLGFGLTNPDGDDANPTTKLTLKPRPTVVFFPTNLLLHAFKAATAEEMWAYLPFDQLDHPLQLISSGQSRDNHVYGIAASVRLGDVFVPVPFTEGGFTFDGRWRTMLLFGRGPGGKHLTALDVTAPGPFTRPALETNPPWVMWSRGNPDVDLTGAAVRNAGDTFAYSRMGETWSVPALGRTTQTPEWWVWVGSGYTDDPLEGRMFYGMDAVTGDVLMSQDVGNAGAPNNIAFNALVASPSAWNYYQLRPPRQVWGDGAADVVSRVYIPDLHGRIWKFNTSSGAVFYDAGVLQPFTEAVALGWLGPTTGDFVYAGAGRDTREGEAPGDPPVPPAFKIFGVEDTQGDAGNNQAGTLAFSEDYPDVFRNRTQPAVAFAEDPLDPTTLYGRVFFLGQRFNPPGASCISSFDAVLFALGGETGAYVYDFSGDNVGDPYAISTGEAPLALAVEGGRVERPSTKASPTPFTKPSPPDVASPQIITRGIGLGSPVCRN